LDLGTGYKIFTCVDSDYAMLTFKDFQAPFTSNSKTFKALLCFENFPASENVKHFQELSRKCGHSDTNVSILLPDLVCTVSQMAETLKH